MLSNCQGESRKLMPIPGFRSYTTNNSSLQLLVHNKHSVERIHTLDPADSSIIWVVLTEAGIISDKRGVKTDRVTLVGCCSRLADDGDTALVSQVDSLKQKYSDHVDVMLVLVGEAVNHVSDESAVLGAVRARSAVSVAGMRVIATQGVKYDLDQVEAVSVVKQDKRLCLCCDAGFRTSQQLEEHNKTGKHRQARLYKHYQLNSDRLRKNPHELGLEIELVEQDAGIEYGSEPGLVSIVAKPKEVKKFKLKLRNGRAPEGDEDRDPSNPKGIILDRFGPAKEDSVFVFEDEKGLLAGTKLRLKYDKKMKVKVKAMSDQIGHYRVPVLVGFYHETHSDMQRDSDGDMAHVLSHMAVELLLKVQTDEMRDLRPVAPHVQKKTIKRWSAKETVQGMKIEFDPTSDKLVKKIDLDQYNIPKIRGKLIYNKFREFDTNSSSEREEYERCVKLLENSLNEKNYKDKLQLLLHCHEKQESMDIRHYDMEGAVMKKMNNGYFSLEVPGLEENRPSVMKGDKILVKIDNSNDKEYVGMVHQIQESRVWLGFGIELSGVHLKNMKFDVKFTVSRFPLRNMHRAVALVQDQTLKTKLFPTSDLLPGASSTRKLPASKFGAIMKSSVDNFESVKNQILGKCE